MTARAWLRADVLTDLRAAGGQRVAAIPEVLTVAGRRHLAGDEEVTITLPVDGPAEAELVDRRVLAMVYDDGTVEEWRIASHTKAREAGAGGARRFTVVASPVLRELVDRCIIRRVESDGTIAHQFEALGLTPTQHIDTYILPSLAAKGAGWWELGTIDAVEALETFVYDWDTPLAALRRLAEDTGTELRVRRITTENGTEPVGPNLVLNGDFESGIGSPVAADSCWTAIGTGTLDYETAVPVSGTRSLKITGAPAADTGMEQAAFPIRIPAGQQLEFSARGRVSGAGIVGWVQIVFYDASDNVVAVSPLTAFGTTDATKSATATVPALATYAVIEAVYDATSVNPGDVIVDDISVRRIRREGYAIDLLTEIGSEHDELPVRLGHNLESVHRTVSHDDQATEIYPRGAEVDGFRADMAEAVWEVLALDALSDRVYLGDPAGGDGPIAFDDQLNGLWLERPDGTRDEIEDTLLAHQAVVIATIAGLVVGDLVKVRASAAGERLTSLSAPADLAQYGRKVAMHDRPDIASTRNVVRNPAFRDGLTGYSAIGGALLSVSTDAAHWRQGGQAVIIETAAAGEGIRCDAVTVTPTEQHPYGSAFASLWLVSGRVRLELVATDGVTTWVIPDGTEGKADTDEIGTWVEIGIADQQVNLHALGVTSIYLRVVQDGPTAAVFRLDTMQITQTPENETFIEGSGATQLWQAANTRLLVYAPPSVQVGARVLDYGRIDPAAFPAHELAVGRRVRLMDPELGIDVLTRLLGYQYGPRPGLLSSVELSNRAEDLSDMLIRPERPVRRRPRTLTRTDITVEMGHTAVAGQPGTVLVTLSARPDGADIFYLRQDVGDPTPAIGDAAYTAYTGPFLVSATEDPLVIMAYARAGTRVSAVRPFHLDNDTIATIPDLQLSEEPAGTLVASWAPDDDVVDVLVFLVKDGAGDGYPTLDGTINTDPDPALYVGHRAPASLGPGSLADGTFIGGGTTWDDAGWLNGEVAGMALVPIERRGNVGAAVFAKRTMAGIVSPALTAATAALVPPVDGVLVKVDLAWTVNSGATAADVIRVYESENGGAYVLVDSVTDPITNTGTTRTTPWVASSGKFDPAYSWRYRIDLVVSGSVAGNRTTDTVGTVVNPIF